MRGAGSTLYTPSAEPSDEEKFWTLLNFILWIVLLAPAIIVWGWAFSLLWLWFTVPIAGLPALTIAQAAGLRLTLIIATSSVWHREDTRTQKEKFRDSILASFVMPLLILGVAWIITLFLPIGAE